MNEWFSWMWIARGPLVGWPGVRQLQCIFPALERADVFSPHSSGATARVCDFFFCLLLSYSCFLELMDGFWQNVFWLWSYSKKFQVQIWRLYDELFIICVESLQKSFFPNSLFVTSIKSLFLFQSLQMVSLFIQKNFSFHLCIGVLASLHFIYFQQACCRELYCY